MTNMLTKPSAKSMGVVRWMRPTTSRPEDLDAGRDGDEQGGDHHRHAQPVGHAGDEHVVRPHGEPEHEDADERERHQPVAEDRLPRVGGDDLGDDPEAGQHHDVDGRWL